MISALIGRRRRQRRPRASRRTPTQSGSVTVGTGIVLEDGRTKNIDHGPIPPGLSVGPLPLVIDMEGLAGHREVEGAENWVWSAIEDAAAHETWVWTAPDVAVVSHADEPITCRVWLVVDVGGKVPIRELPLTPNDIITVEPGRPAHVSLAFRLRLIFLNEDVRLDPQECPRELVFVEIGGRERRRRVPFWPTPHRSWWAGLVSHGGDRLLCRRGRRLQRTEGGPRIRRGRSATRPTRPEVRAWR